MRGQKSDIVTHGDGRVFLEARTKPKPVINYILFLLYLVWRAPSNSKIHILSQGAIVGQLKVDGYEIFDTVRNKSGVVVVF